MNTAATPVYEWKDINWKHLQKMVFKLQKRIYRASQRGDRGTTRRLQRLLVTSRAAKLLATRKVTQDNRGKRTAGVDGVKNLTPHQRLTLASTLRLPVKAKPTRRVWIPKRGTTEQRPLGIPTLRDRASQTLLTLALEPEWEARFEPNSYGFRPGRAAHDAIEALFISLCHGDAYVLDADIAKCFDSISHTALLQKLQTTPTFRRAIRAWLKAGVLDGGTLFPTEAGTPQGGGISPLLMNVALHGLETAVQAAFPASYRRTPSGRHRLATVRVIRYADDLVAIHKDRSSVEAAQQLVSDWLAEMGLELKPSKTRIVHTLHEHAGQPPGFDFLGFTVRQYPVGKTHTGKRQTGRQRGFKTLIKPSIDGRKRHRHALKGLVKRLRAAPQERVIQALNPVVRGWASYYRTVVAAKTFAAEDNLLYLTLRRWAKRRHPMQSHTWVGRRYWRPGKHGTWTFQTPAGHTLARHSDVHIQRHIKVQGSRSYFDGDWSYWGARLGRHPDLTPLEARLLKQQRGRCAWCTLHFAPGDHVEQDHIVPVSRGGGEAAANRQLLHGHCHDAKTARDGSSAVRCS